MMGPDFTHWHGTYEVAKQIDLLEPLLTKDGADKIALLERLVRDNVDLAVDAECQPASVR
jgi:hypothetical protein